MLKLRNFYKLQKIIITTSFNSKIQIFDWKIIKYNLKLKKGVKILTYLIKYL